MTDSVRLQILQKIEDAFRGVQPPDPDDINHTPSDSDWPFAFSTVEIGPLADEDHRKRYAVGIVPGPEKERFTYPYIECNWTVGIEFRVTVNKNDPKPAIMGERALTVIKRVVDLDRTWGGLAIDTKRKGTEIDMTTYGDKSVVGVLFIEVMFRHSHFDPRDPQPDV